MTDRLRKKIRERLTELLTEAATPGSILKAGEIRATGIPKKWAYEIAEAARSVRSGADAVDTADEFSKLIDADLERQEAEVRDGTMADRIRRFN
jgi:hypothetical protein